jgi:hypothetical protein
MQMARLLNEAHFNETHFNEGHSRAADHTFLIST